LNLNLNWIQIHWMKFVLNWIQIKFNWVLIQLNWIQISKLKWIKLNTIFFSFGLAWFIFLLKFQLNWIWLKWIKFNSIQIHWVQTNLNSTWFHLNYFHNFVEVNSTKLWKFNNENVHVNLPLHIHVGGLTKEVK
jgi:hypothetical protein